MNKPIARALFLDAYYQVLDNKVFRLLAIVASLLVLPTFVLGAREQGLVILYGVKTVPWEDIGWLVGGLRNHALIVQRYQDIVVGGLAGTIGILFAIAATAFFVPRMLEKGAADVVFSRPVSRHVLLLARYCAGVLFVAILSTALVLGMHIGLLLVSGTSDPAFLWSVAPIVYKLRKAISEGPPLLRDEAAGLSVLAAPRGLQLSGAHGKVDLSQEPARWTPLPDAPEGRTEISLRREARQLDGKRRSARTAAKNLVTELQKSGAKVAQQAEVGFGPGLHPDSVSWTETEPDGTWSRSTGFLAAGEWLYVLEARARGENTSESGPALTVLALAHEFRIDDNDQDPSKWYQRQLDWFAPLRHNIFFSIGSSLTFVLLLFALAAWKLKRIDF